MKFLTKVLPGDRIVLIDSDCNGFDLQRGSVQYNPDLGNILDGYSNIIDYSASAPENYMLINIVWKDVDNVVHHVTLEPCEITGVWEMTKRKIQLK